MLANFRGAFFCMCSLYFNLYVRNSTYVHSTHASQVIICNHNTDKVLYELYVSTLNQVCNFS